MTSLTVDRPDVIVVGAGIMGRAVAWQVAQRGASVLVIEQNRRDTADAFPSCSACSLSYCHPNVAFSRLAMHAFTWWRVAERVTDTTLMTSCGELDIGYPGTPSFDERLVDVRNLGLDHELLSPQAISRRFPTFHLPDGSLGLYHPGAARIDGQRAMHAFGQLAQDLGVQFLWDTRVADYSTDSAGCRVQVVDCSEGSPYGMNEIRSERLILCAGPWSGDLVGSWPPLQILRQESCSFATTGGPANSASDFPMFSIHLGTGANTGVCGDFCADSCTDGARVPVRVSQLDGLPVDCIAIPEPSDSGNDDALVDCVRRFLPELNSECIGKDTHFSAETPNGGPCLDWLGQEKRAFLCAGFSPLGFGLAPVVGAAVADLLDGGDTDYEIGAASMSRFARS